MQQRDFGPDRTTREQSPPTLCPRCDTWVHARRVMQHGLEHRAADERAGACPGGGPLAADQVLQALVRRDRR